MAALVTLTTDFGGADGYVGAMKGVIARLAPGARVVDVAHEVPSHDVAHAAWVVRTAWREFPIGTVHVVVVDPWRRGRPRRGGGGGRRPPLRRARQRRLRVRRGSPRRRLRDHLDRVPRAVRRADLPRPRRVAYGITVHLSRFPDAQKAAEYTFTRDALFEKWSYLGAHSLVYVALAALVLARRDS